MRSKSQSFVVGARGLVAALAAQLAACGGGHAEDDQEAVDAAAAALTFEVIAGDNPAPTDVTTDLELPLELGDAVEVSWAASDEGVVSPTGEVLRDECLLDDAPVTLTAKLTRGEASATVEIDVEVRRHSDAEAVELAGAALEPPDAEDLELTTAGECETDIAWAADTALVDVDAEVVVFPYDGDVEATLTATIARGEAEADEEFPLVLAEGPFSCAAWELIGDGDASGFAYGEGDEATEPYYVCAAEHLDAIRDVLAADIALGADVELGAEFGGGSGWLPIGEADDPFTGVFDGQGFAIEGLTIDREETDFVGLFAATEGAIVIGVSLEDASVVGNDQVGGIAGEVRGGRVEEVSVAGLVQAREGLFGGGVAGRVEDGGVIAASETRGAARGSGDIIGGLVGAIEDGTLRDSHSRADVDGGEAIGGAVGRLAGDGLVERTFATGDVVADSSADKFGAQAGGLVGEHRGAIVDCYARGRVEAETGAGGLVGRSEARIETSYATGEVDAESAGGGLVGIRFAGQIVDSYWDVDSTLAEDGVGSGSDEGASGRTTDEMTVPFEGETFDTWDFAEVWDGEAGRNDGYPFLRSVDASGR